MSHLYLTPPLYTYFLIVSISIGSQYIFLLLWALMFNILHLSIDIYKLYILLIPYILFLCHCFFFQHDTPTNFVFAYKLGNKSDSDSDKWHLQCFRTTAVVVALLVGLSFLLFSFPLSLTHSCTVPFLLLFCFLFKKIIIKKLNPCVFVITVSTNVLQCPRQVIFLIYVCVYH